MGSKLVRTPKIRAVTSKSIAEKEKQRKKSASRPHEQSIKAHPIAFEFYNIIRIPKLAHTTNTPYCRPILWENVTIAFRVKAVYMRAHLRVMKNEQMSALRVSAGGSYGRSNRHSVWCRVVNKNHFWNVGIFQARTQAHTDLIMHACTIPKQRRIR